MDGLEHLLTQYGPAVLPLVIFLGAFAEGHTLVIAGGLFAHQGHLTLWSAFFWAWFGSFLADQILFHLGRSFREKPFVAKAAASKAGRKAVGFVEKNPNASILIFRFIYGVRLAAPVALGFTTVPTARFTVLNIIGAVLWAGVFTVLGYFFGETIQRTVGSSKAVEHWLIGGSIVLVLLLVLWHLFQWWRKKRLPVDELELSGED